jgi:hypothetical protein
MNIIRIVYPAFPVGSANTTKGTIHPSIVLPGALKRFSNNPVAVMVLAGFERSFNPRAISWGCSKVRRLIRDLCLRAKRLDFIINYNFARLHSTLGYKSPIQYEKEQFLKVA